jgi:hypothetical protein
MLWCVLIIVSDCDWEALEFSDESRVFHFPRDNHCDIMYCNVEGVSCYTNMFETF